MDPQLLDLIQSSLNITNSLNSSLLQIAENTKQTWSLNWSSISSIATALSAIATMILAILTWKMVKEMKQARLDTSRPYVIAYLEYKEHQVFFICENIGKTTAQNVKLDFDTPLLGIENYEVSKELFSSPIPSMPPTHQIKTFVNSSINILENNKDLLNITIKYASGDTQYIDNYPITFSKYQKILFTYSEENRQLQALEKISEDFTAIRKVINPPKKIEGAEVIEFMINRHKKN